MLVEVQAIVIRFGAEAKYEAIASMEDVEFEKLVAAGMDAVSEELARHISNVAVVIADEPTKEQKRELKLWPHIWLFGLYQGVPKTSRENYQLVLSDKITIFKNSIVEAADGNHERIKIR